MKAELREWRNGILVSVGHSVERMKNNTLSEHDRTSFANMLLQFAQAVMKDSEYMKETVMQETANNILGAFDDLMNSNADSLEWHYDALIQLAAFGEIITKPEDYERFKPREDGRTYIDFLPTSMTNEQSSQIVEHLKSIGAKFDLEVGQWYVEADWQMPNLELLKEKENEMEKEDNSIKEQFKAYYYDKNGERQEVLGETRDAVIQAVREAKPERKETERCYIQEYDTKAEKYQQEGIYLIESGRDVTPVEIEIPRMSQDAFKEVTTELKQMGVKFNKSQKIWYAERSDYPETSLQIHNYLDTKSKYKAVYYVNSEKREIFAETKELAIEAVREDKTELKESDRCYIHENDTTAGKYQREGIYLIESGKDVTPIELNLPYMRQETFNNVKVEIKGMGAKFNVDQKVWYVERGEGQNMINAIKDCLQKHDEGTYLKLPDKMSAEQFKTTVEQFKQSGARYNPDKKAWYITEKNDRDKFSDYLSSDKASVLEKLEHKKNLATEQSKNNGKTLERNRDNHERV